MKVKMLEELVSRIDGESAPEKPFPRQESARRKAREVALLLSSTRHYCPCSHLAGGTWAC